MRRASTDKLLTTISVPAHGMRRLLLGTFDQETPMPELCIDIDADNPDVVNYSINRLDKPDVYALIYHFQNFGDRVYRVKVRDCTNRIRHRVPVAV